MNGKQKSMCPGLWDSSCVSPLIPQIINRALYKVGKYMALPWAGVRVYFWIQHQVGHCTATVPTVQNHRIQKKCHLAISKTSIIFVYEKEYNYYRSTEYRNSLGVELASNNYILMNSHIWHWSPSFRVAIICHWGWKRIDRQPEAKNNGHAPRDYYYLCLGYWQALVESERSNLCP